VAYDVVQSFSHKSYEFDRWPPIILWKTNPNGSLKLCTKVPCPIPYHLICGNDVSRSAQKEKFISARLSKYVDFWKVGIAQSSTYEMKMRPYVEY
jgi:hypothetical protein